MLREYQVHDLAYYIANERCLNLSDPGTGKTPSVCAYLYWMWSYQQERSVWVMPTSLLEKNRDELLRFSSFQPSDVTIVQGRTDNQTLIEVVQMAAAGRLSMTLKEQKVRPGRPAKLVPRFIVEPEKAGKKPTPISAEAVEKARKKALVAVPEEPGPVPITQAGVQALEQKLIDPFHGSDAKAFLMGFDTFAEQWPHLLERYPNINLVAVDELHMGFSTAKSKRTESWFRSMKKIDRFVGMTGTLIDGRYSSAYPAIHVIEPRYYGSEANFIATHAELDFYGNIIGWQKPEKIRAILAKHSVRHTFEEVYGPEAKIIIPEPVSMSPKQAKMYEVLHEKALIELEDSFVDAGAPGVFAIRARQILAHPEVFECDEPTGKDEWLEIKYADPGPAVVFACFKPEQERLQRLAAKSGRRAGLMNGDTSPKERERLSQMFQAGDLDTMICSQKVAAVGFNWHHTEWMTFTSIDYQDSSFFQAYRRAIRGKRGKALRIYVPQYRDSIDYRIFEIVERKSREAAAVDPTREVFSLAANE